MHVVLKYVFKLNHKDIERDRDREWESERMDGIASERKQGRKKHAHTLTRLDTEAVSYFALNEGLITMPSHRLKHLYNDIVAAEKTNLIFLLSPLTQ